MLCLDCICTQYTLISATGILYTYLCKQKLNISVIVGFKIRNGPRYTIPPQKLFKIQLNLSTKIYWMFRMLVKAKYTLPTSEGFSI